MKTRSLLPNSSLEILTPIKTKAGTLQVVWIEQIDAHGLFLEIPEGKQMVLATHHNGYSCHELAKRLAAGEKERAIQQLEYIRDCGGLGKTQSFIELFF